MLANDPVIPYHIIIAKTPVVEAGTSNFRRCIMKLFAVALISALFVSVPVGAQKSRKDITPAPLPKQILNGKKIFILNKGGSDPALKEGGGAELVYDVVYSELKAWSRYEIVDSAKGADLVFELSYGAENARTRVWTSTNTYSGTSQVHSGTVSDATIRLTIVDPGTQDVLWATSEVRDRARREKNREKNLINTAKKVIENFKHRIEASK
jgi:hypothetical protein